MTRAQGPDGEIDFRSFGAPGAARMVLLLRTGAIALADPNPKVTLAHDVRLVTVSLDDAEFEDSPVFGGETPAASTAAALVVLARRESGGAAIGLVGERAAAPLAVAVAAQAESLVDRFALIGAAVPDNALSADLLADKLATVVVPTVVVSESEDPAQAAHWYAERLRSANVTPAPLAEGENGDGMSDAWAVALAHVAPGTDRA